MKIDNIGLYGTVDKEWLEKETMPDECRECGERFREGDKAYMINPYMFDRAWYCRECAKQVKVVQNL